MPWIVKPGGAPVAPLGHLTGGKDGSWPSPPPHHRRNRPHRSPAARLNPHHPLPPRPPNQPLPRHLIFSSSRLLKFLMRAARSSWLQKPTSIKHAYFNMQEDNPLLSPPSLPWLPLLKRNSSPLQHRSLRSVKTPLSRRPSRRICALVKLTCPPSGTWRSALREPFHPPHSLLEENLP